MSREGEEILREKGTPQGGVVSPILSNLFLHYAFDLWMTRTYPEAPFARYADDAVIHCRSKGEAEEIKRKLERRFAEVGLELHPEKTKTIYCRDSSRRGGKGEEIQFDFLGYTFKPRLAVNKQGKTFSSFSPAISRGAKKAINKTVRKGRHEVVRVRRNRATCCARDEGRPLGVGRQGQASNYFATDNP